MLTRRAGLRVRAAAALTLLLMAGGVGVALVGAAEPGAVVALGVGGNLACANSDTKTPPNEPTAQGGDGAADRAAFHGRPDNTIAVPDPNNPNILYVSDVEWVRRVTLSLNKIETIAGTVHLPGKPTGDVGDNVADAENAFVRVLGMTISDRVIYLVEANATSTAIRVRTLKPTVSATPLDVAATWRLDTIATDVTQSGVHHGIAVAPDGKTIYVAQPETGPSGGLPGRLARLQGDQFVTVASTGLSLPQDVSIDAGGRIYVADTKGVHEVTPGGGLVPVGGDYSKSLAARRVAVSPDGTRLLVADLSTGTISQVNLDESRNERKDLAGKTHASSLWFRSPTNVLVGTSCRLFEARLIEKPATTVTDAPVSSLTAPTSVASSNVDSRPPASPVQEIVPVTGGNPSADFTSVFGQSQGEQSLAPPPVSAGEILGTGSGSGSATGSGIVVTPPPPPVVAPTPTPFLSPSPLLSGQGAVAADPTAAAMAAPRHAMVRFDPSTSPGPAAVGLGVVVLIGCVALCAIGLSRDKGHAQRAPARAARARARAW